MAAVELREWQGTAVGAWRGRWGAPELHVLTATGSTNDVARELAVAGAPEGTTVLTEDQTQGRGRRGREWRADPGQSLALSMVVRPGRPGADSVLSLRLGLAAARAIEAELPLAVALKWPNDLLVDGRKVGGLLCEGALEVGRFQFVVAGLGLNVAQDDEAWPAPLAGRASSLAARSGREPERGPLAGAIVQAWLAALGGGARLSAAELEAFARRDALRDRPVTVDGGTDGVARGIEPDGALRLERGGVVERVVAGTVRLREDTEEGDA